MLERCQSGCPASAGTLWSLGKLNARPPELLQLLATRVEQLLQELDMWEVGNVMTAFSRLQYTPSSPSLLPALMELALVRGRLLFVTLCLADQQHHQPWQPLVSLLMFLLCLHRRAWIACQSRRWPMCRQLWRGCQLSLRRGRLQRLLQQNFVGDTAALTSCPSLRRSASRSVVARLLR